MTAQSKAKKPITLPPQEAIDAIYKWAAAEAIRLRDEEELTLNQACDRASKILYLLPLKAENIRGRVRTVEKVKETPERSRKMLKSEEEFLEKLARAFSKTLNALWKEELLYLANRVFKLRCPLEKELTKGWLDYWLHSRADSLVVRKGKSSHKKSILLSRYPAVKQWVEEVGKRLAEQVLDPDLIFNIDETMAVPKDMPPSVVADASLPEAHTNQVKNTALYTLVSCVSASGKTLFALFILRKPKTKNVTHMGIYVPKEAESRTSRSSTAFPIYYAATPSGYMNAELWRSILAIFLALVEPLQGVGRGKRAVLFVDGCSSHRQVDTVEPLAKSNVLVIYFPSNTSHILQPLDGYVFACYKPRIRSAIRLLSLAALVTNESKNNLILSISIEAAKKSFTADAIMRSFRDRGIYPWDPELILANTIRSTGKQPDVTVSEEEFDRYTFDSIFDDYIEKVREGIETEKVYLAAHNAASPSKDLPKTPKRSSAKKTSTVKAKKTRAVVNDEEEADDVDTEVNVAAVVAKMATLMAQDVEIDGEEDDYSEASCDYCEHETLRRKLSRVCFECEGYWLCRKCSFDSKILQEHFKEKHLRSEKASARAPRKRSLSRNAVVEEE